MSRPDYVRCETCVYCEVFEKDGDRSGSCRADRSMEGYFTELGSFCRHWRSTWPVEYQGFLVSSDLKTWTLELGVAPPPEVPQAEPVEAETELRPALWYGGRDSDSEWYFKGREGAKNLRDAMRGTEESETLCVREGDDLRWTPEDLEAIAADMRAREEASKP